MNVIIREEAGVPHSGAAVRGRGLVWSAVWRMCKHRHAAFGLGLVCRPAGTAGRQLCRSTRLSARGLAAVSVYCATAAALGWQRSDSGSDYAVQLLLLKELHKAKKSVASAADFPVSMASDEEVIKSG